MKSTSLFSLEPAKGWIPWGALAPFLLIFFVAAPVIFTDKPFIQWGFVDDSGNPIGAHGLYAFLIIPFAMTGALVLAWVLFVLPFRNSDLILKPDYKRNMRHKLWIGL